ncbi:unnamed protein product [Spodoptera exigua]|nr:unnamed protein product [Spodoptera exigua]
MRELLVYIHVCQLLVREFAHEKFAYFGRKQIAEVQQKLKAGGSGHKEAVDFAYHKIVVLLTAENQLHKDLGNFG